MPRTRTSFQPGWKGGPGRPKGSKNKVSEMRAALMDLTNEEEVAAVMRSVVWAARARVDSAGNVIPPDLAAARLYLDMVVGRAPQQVEVEFDGDEEWPSDQELRERAEQAALRMIEIYGTEGYDPSKAVLEEAGD